MAIIYFFLFSTTKWDIAQPPSFHALKCKLTEFEDCSIKRDFSGRIGFDPFVRVFNISDGSPAPILKDNDSN